MKQTNIIDELIESGLFGEHVAIEAVKGGAINRSFRLLANDTQYFLKTFELNHIAPSDRQALFIQQAQLADHQKAAKPIYLSRSHDFQVEEWVEHTSLLNSSLRHPDKITFLARVLWEIHQLPTFALSIDLPKNWMLYLENADDPDDVYWLDRIDKCKPAWIDTHKVDQVLCHNDLAMEHIALTEPAVIFDWEYAALGNRFFDLASCALINKLDEHDTIALQTHYAQLCGLSTEYVFEQCQLQFPIVALTNDLWYLVAKTVKKDIG
ncbi:phosphotransferase [Aliiglaciecola litoralis]|uniref:Aminoglycoside phosphotransferase domain-containing protein n=1 Tax=Aliiglaciecola litoralis TaxID=582857 RepID=A0ABN1LLP9_9ALTE